MTRCLPSRENLAAPTPSAGSFTAGRLFDARTSYSSSSERPLTFHARAANVPCSLRRKPSSSASERFRSTSIGPGSPLASRRMRPMRSGRDLRWSTDRSRVRLCRSFRRTARCLRGREDCVSSVGKVEEIEIVVPSTPQTRQQTETTIPCDARDRATPGFVAIRSIVPVATSKTNESRDAGSRRFESM